jgi:hypothetical protein
MATTILWVSSLEAKELTTVEYTVVAGDTMDNIARQFLPTERGDSYKAFAEFREGIFEYNFNRVFYDREPYEVKEGDTLLIVFWQ